MRQIHKFKGKIRAKKGVVSLTFDDGPDPVYTPKVLDALKNFNLRATFFLVGRRVKQYPNIVRRIHREGHDVGNHTYSHPVSPLIRFKRNRFIKREIIKTNRIIKDIVGDYPLLFRPPLADWDVFSKRLVMYARQAGHLSVGWSKSSVDWLGSSFITDCTLLPYLSKAGGIILLHDGAAKTLVKRRDATVKLIPKIAKICGKKNLKIAPLTELIKIDSSFG